MDRASVAEWVSSVTSTAEAETDATPERRAQLHEWGMDTLSEAGQRYVPANAAEQAQVQDLLGQAAAYVNEQLGTEPVAVPVPMQPVEYPPSQGSELGIWVAAALGLAVLAVVVTGGAFFAFGEQTPEAATEIGDDTTDRVELLDRTTPPSTALEETTGPDEPLFGSFENPWTVEYDSLPFSTTSGDLEAREISDVFDVDLNKGQPLSAVVEASGTGALDPVLSIMFEDGTLVGTVTRDGSTANAAVTAPLTGRYFIILEGNTSSRGRYNLSIFPEEIAVGDVTEAGERGSIEEELDAGNRDDSKAPSQPPEPVSTPLNLEEFTFASGTVPEASSRLFQVTLDEGQRVTISLHANESDLAPVIAVEQRGFGVIASDSAVDSATRTSSVDFVTPQSGRYTFIVQGFGQTAGDFEMAINLPASETLPDSIPGDNETPSPEQTEVETIVLDLSDFENGDSGAASTTGTAASGRRTIYEVVFAAGQQVSIEANATGGSELDPVLTISLNRNPIASNDDADRSTRDSRVDLLAPQTGVYEIEVLPFVGTSGDYELVIEFDEFDATGSENLLPTEERQGIIAEPIDTSNGVAVIAGTISGDIPLAYEVQAGRSQLIVVAVNPSSGPNQLNPSLTITFEGRPIVVDEDGEAFTQITADESGTYIIWVTSADESRGDFLMDVLVADQT